MSDLREQPLSGAPRSWLRWPIDLTLLWLMMPVVVLFRVGLSAAAPHDLWWPIVQGRAAQQLGHTPTENLFLFTLPASEPFFNQPWLAQAIMWHALDGSGVSALCWLNAIFLSAAVAAGMALAMRREHDPKILGAFAAIALVFASGGFSVRTQMFAYPSMVVVLGVSLLVAEGRLRWRWMLLPALCTTWWANVHGAFVLAPLLVGAVATGDLLDTLIKTRRVDTTRLSRWTMSVAGVALAACVNPVGFGVYVYAFTLTLKMSGADVSEWTPHELDAAGLLFYTCALVAIVAALIKRDRVGWRSIIPLLGISALAVGGVRNMLWWGLGLYILLAPLTARPSSSEPQEAITTGQSLLNLFLVLGLCTSALAAMPGMPLFNVLTRAEDPEGLEGHLPYEGMRPLDRQHPLRLIRSLEDGEHAGRIFHEQAIGGLLQYALAREAPAQVAFVDQRFGMIPQHIWDDYMAIANAEPDWRERLQKHDIKVLLISSEMMPRLSYALNKPDSGWERVEEPEFTFELWVPVAP